jgi:hypothetical protein
MERYMIRGLIYLGYWQSDRRSFKGYLFGTKFINKSEAISEAKRACYEEACEVITVYIYE